MMIKTDGKRFANYMINCLLKGIVQLRTNEFSSVTTEAETFECNSKIIKVTFGASRTLSSGVTETPLKLNSSLCFEFDSTEDYAFI